MSTTRTRRIVVVGDGIAGISAAQGARRQAPDAQVIVIGDETRPPYYRLRLCEIVSGRNEAEKLWLHPDAWYAQNGIELRTGVRAQALHPLSRCLELADGSVLPYDALVLATGSVSFLPPVAGAARPGVHTLWTMDDAYALRHAVDRSCRDDAPAVVVGGGLLGLEAAYHIAQSGCATTVLELLPRLMARQLDAHGANLLAARAASVGIRVRTGVTVATLEADGGDADPGPVAAVRLQDNSRLAAQVVLFSAGVRARTELARQANIRVGQRIQVDPRLRTDTDGVYAAGDCAEVNGFWSGQWLVAREQGLCAGANAAGGAIDYTPAPPAFVLNTLGTSLVSAGLFDPPGPGEEGYDPEVVVATDGDPDRFVYRKRVTRAGRLVGFLLLGETGDAQKWLREMSPA